MGLGKFSRYILFVGALGQLLPQAIAAKERIDNIPMYGQPGIKRPAYLKKADEDFIQKASGGFGGDRKAACFVWCRQGEKFLLEMNLDYAMRRFNQGWLLDPQNYLPYWGFGRVLLQKDQFEESVRHFETAIGKCTEPHYLPALLSDAATAYSFQALYTKKFSPEEKRKTFAQANDYFRRSTEFDPKNANAWIRWAMSLHREENFQEAWVKVRQARSLGVTSFPKDIIEALTKASPEPKTDNVH